ncbi:hypothetical protein D3C80_2117400 [compost metagenome]
MDTSQGFERGTQAADFDPQAGAMGFIAEFQAKRLGNEDFPGHIGWPGFGQCSCEGEEDRALR